ncbi:hypothetical protein COU12_01790 [Candidatus Jorgensenbacteria bacterium CG10_big_fil_rev_8_21_14_0_10_54_38]|uniref:Hydrolase TatD n=2 Tax=Candidatus Joergenseniibacteriota TaxID=1752739 RepID=A0A2M6WG11_9BACT|nr:MAG: hypothetical protein COX26_01420 [Candidatus Jorgensenbacteria bacterium CG23_combo_of_CG06-09_8_20_14_all_54_14]PIT91674.1 MAG: hypothetical protein COU12_01790 [Candidatus Jorgensenbacteria bacterium CG10_big_fil_rev_8_21_14_0_10_54_38]
MKFQYFDAHTHAQFAAYDSDRDAVLARARATGVGMITVGTQRDTSLKAVEVARVHENVWAAVGLHPVHTGKSFHDVQELGGGEAARGFAGRGEEFDHEYYRKLAEDPKVVAIGECGLDYAVFVSDRVLELQKRAPRQESGFSGEEVRRIKEKQREAFEAQIKFAHEVQKPLMIHCRSAFSDLISILTPNASRLNPSVIHFFSGTLGDAKKLLDMGFYFTFGGVITFPPKAGRLGDYDEVIKIIPPERILSETDAPYVAPVPYRGKRNEPAYVVEVVKKLAELNGMTAEATAEQIAKNAERVFGLQLNGE